MKQTSSALSWLCLQVRLLLKELAILQDEVLQLRLKDAQKSTHEDLQANLQTKVIDPFIAQINGLIKAAIEQSFADEKVKMATQSQTTPPSKMEARPATTPSKTSSTTTPSKTSSATSPSKISLANTTPSKISSSDTTPSKASSAGITSSKIAPTCTSSKISSASYPQSTSNMSTSSMLEPSLSKIIHGPPVIGTGGKKIKIRQPTSKPGIDYTSQRSQMRTLDYSRFNNVIDSDDEEMDQDWMDFCFEELQKYSDFNGFND